MTVSLSYLYQAPTGTYDCMRQDVQFKAFSSDNKTSVSFLNILTPFSPKCLILFHCCNSPTGSGGEGQVMRSPKHDLLLNTR